MRRQLYNYYKKEKEEEKDNKCKLAISNRIGTKVYEYKDIELFFENYTCYIIFDNKLKVEISSEEYNRINSIIRNKYKGD